MPLLWIAVSLFLGLVIGKILPWVAWGWLTLAGAVLLLWPVFRRFPAHRPKMLARLHWAASKHPALGLPPLLLLAVMFAGAARFVLALPGADPSHISALNDTGAYKILATVADYPDVRDQSTQLRVSVIQAAALNEEGQPKAPVPTHGLLLAMLPGRADYHYGDRLVLEGRPVTPPENEEFSYRAYLARQNVYSYLTYPRIEFVSPDNGSPLLATIFRLRDWAKTRIDHLYPAPEAPLLAGILLGLDNDLPPGLARAFQNTGTAHVIAISGFNIAILSALFAALFGRIVSRWWAIILSVLAITAYTLMVGATPSVVRAAIMGGMSLLAHAIGRRSAGLNTLFVTGGLMALQNPHLPWDASFQLSFGATAGLVVFGDRFQSGFQALLARRIPTPLARKITGPVGEYVLLTLAAQLMTLPVILFHFQRLSLSSLLANPLILPPQPLVMVFSGLAVLASAVSDPLAHVLGWLAWPLSAYTIRMVELLDRIPGGVLVLDQMDVGTVVLLYAAILAPVVSGRLPALLRTQIRPGLLAWGALLLAAVLWRAVLAAPDGRLHLTVLDLDHAQVVLIRGPGGETLLLGAGHSPRLLRDALGRRLSPLDRRLDGLLLNTSQADSTSALPGIIEQYPPARAWWAGDLPTQRAGQRIVTDLENAGIPIHPLSVSDALPLGRGADLTVLASGADGSALLLTHASLRVLLPGGVPLANLSPAHTAHLTLLVLDPRDLETTPAQDWLALGARSVIYTPAAGEVPPSGMGWRSTSPGGWYTLSSDGARIWVEGQ